MRTTLARPVVLAASDPLTCEALSFAMRRSGAEVVAARTADTAVALAIIHQTDTIVLALDLEDESGWLTCAKSQLSHPHLRVLLYGPDTASNRRKAAFVGAAALIGTADALTDWLMPATRN